jgi:hypothetical protein
VLVATTELGVPELAIAPVPVPVETTPGACACSASSSPPTTASNNAALAIAASRLEANDKMQPFGTNQQLP